MDERLEEIKERLFTEAEMKFEDADWMIRQLKQSQEEHQGLVEQLKSAKAEIQEKDEDIEILERENQRYKEKVQDLETLLHGSKLMTDEALETIDKLWEENQRYKEALEKITKENSIYFMLKIARQALKGES